MKSLGQLFEEAWGLYAQNFWFLVGLSLIWNLIIGGAVLILVLPFLFGVVLLAGLSESSLALQVLAGVIFGLLALVAFLAIAYLGAASIASLLKAIYEKAQANREFGLAQAISFGFKRGLAMLGVGIIKVLLVGLGLILLIIPGVILATWFALTENVVALEERPVLDSFSRSKALVHRHFWWVLWVFLVVLVMQVGAGMIPYLGFLISLVLWPFFGAIEVGLFQDLKAAFKKP